MTRTETAIFVGGLLSIAFAFDAGPCRAQAPANERPDPAAQTIVEGLLQRYREPAMERWENDIRKLEARDARETEPENAILFVGSSSIRLWDSIDADMQPYAVIQRGYGGAKFTDLAVFAHRLITPHRYRALVLFVANDVTGGDDDRSPREVEALLMHVFAISRKHQPDAPVFVIEITPTSSRWKVWPEIAAVNAALRARALQTPGLFFIPTAAHYLNDQARPRDHLFRDDRLHLNTDGYDLWAKRIKRRLGDFLPAGRPVSAEERDLGDNK